MAHKQILQRHPTRCRRLRPTRLLLAAALFSLLDSHTSQGQDQSRAVLNSSNQTNEPRSEYSRNERIDELCLRLARIVERPAHEQHYEQITAEATRMLENSRSASDREQLRELLNTINQHRTSLEQSPVERTPARVAVATDYFEDAYVMPAQFQRSSTTGQMSSGGQMPSFNAPTQRTPANFNVRLARAPKMLGDFFGVGGSSSQIFQSIGEIGVADEGPGLFAPQGPFNVVSLVEQSGSDFLYVFGPPIPFGELLIDRQNDFNEDGISDFVLSADPTKAGITGLSTDVSYAAVSNGIVTPSTHNLYDLFEFHEIVLPSPGDIIGRVRLSENNSAMPQDRVYFDYSYFHNVPLSFGGVAVHRFAPGAEKTFLDGMASVEVRVPTGLSLSSDIVSGAPADVSHGEFGNIVISPKVLLAETESVAFAAGCGVALPTADDIIVTDTNGNLLLLVNNEAVHLLPYLAFLYAPNNSPFFGHAFLTLDLDMGGNSAFADPDGNGFRQVGVLNDQNLISTHIALGSWIYQNASRAVRLQGIALSAELHTTNSLNDADSVALGSGRLGNPNANLSLVNATFGAHAQVCQTTFTAGYCTPLSSNRVFDGELRIFVNRAF